MVDRKLKNGAVILKKEGSRYTFQRPGVKGLVLSGGGARGLAYVGMYKTMYETGALEKLTHVAGASAGAMTASMIALGVLPEDFEKISTEIDMQKLIDITFLGGRSDGSRFKNVLQIIYFLQFQDKLSLVDKDHLTNMQKWFYETLSAKVVKYHEVLTTFRELSGIDINSLSDLLDFIKSDENVTENFKALDIALKHASQFTFKDLSLLRNVLPEDKRHLIKKLSVAATDKTDQAQLVYSDLDLYNASLATAVMQSGAHPVMFQPQKSSNKHFIGDGGVLDNMPSETLEHLGLDKQEILCVKVNQADQISDQLRRVNSAKVEKTSFGNKIFDAVLSSFLGGAHKALSMKTREREKVFYDMGNMLFLNSGNITATTTQLTDEQRQFAIEDGEDRTIDMLNDREMRFTNLLEALLYVGEDELRNMTLDLEREEDPELFKMAVIASVISQHQKKIVALLNRTSLSIDDRENVRLLLKALENEIKQSSGLDTSQQDTTYALSLKQINFVTEGKLSKFLEEDIKQNPENSHWAMKILALIVISWQQLINLVSGGIAEYQAANTEALDNSEHATSMKAVLNCSARFFDREPTSRHRDAMIERPNEDLDQNDFTPGQ